MTLALAIAFLVNFAVCVGIAVSDPRDSWLCDKASTAGGFIAIALALSVVL